MAAEFLLILLIAIVAPGTYAVEHIVGGSAGWAPAIDYAKWAAGETFFIGDTLRFNYGDTHGVNQVTLESYNYCRTDTPINAYTGGTTIITLTECGPMYFICPAPGHCVGGMKISIMVFDRTTTPTTPTITTPPGAPGGMIYDSPSDSKPNDTIYVMPFCSASSFAEVNYLIIGVLVVLATMLGFSN